jgi:hypothetical protein
MRSRAQLAAIPMYRLSSILYVLGVAWSAKGRSPRQEQVAGLPIKPAQPAVEHHGADEQHTSRGHDGATVVQRRGQPIAIGGEPYSISLAASERVKCWKCSRVVVLSCGAQRSHAGLNGLRGSHLEREPTFHREGHKSTPQ